MGIRSSSLGALALTALIGGGLASAQEVDPIGDLLTGGPQTDPAATDEAEEPDAPAPAAAPPPFRLAIPPPGAASPAPLSELIVEQERRYEARLRASFAAAQGLQGPLDGAWTIRGEGGAALYTLQLVDRGLGGVDGAWADPSRKGAADASGFLAQAQRLGGRLSLSFDPGGGQVTVQVGPGSGGAWSGELIQGAARRPVTLQRN